MADGPGDWPRVGGDLILPAISESETGVVSDVQLTNDRISFHTTAVGVPHMIKVSYFPDWRANGAEGPYRAAPSTMVVIPTQQDVVLQFHASPAEKAANVVTIVTLLLLLGIGLYVRLRVNR